MVVTNANKASRTKVRFPHVLRVIDFVKPYQGYFFVGLLCLLLSSITLLGFPFFTGKLIDVALGKPSGFFNSINHIALILFMILVAQSIFSFLRVYTFSIVSERSLADLRTALYQKMLFLPMQFFEKHRVGELNSRISADIGLLNDVISTTLAEFFRQISVLVIGTLILFITSPKLTIFMLLSFPPIIILAILFGKIIRKQSKNTQDEIATSNAIVEETIQNIQSVKIFTNEWFEITRYKNALQEAQRSAVRTARNRALFIAFLICGLFGGIVLVLWYGTGLVQTGQMTLGALTSFILYTTFIGASVGGLGDMYGQFQKTLGAIARVFEIFDETTEPHAASEDQTFEGKGDIQFKNVSFAYPTRRKSFAVNQVNFTVPEGKKVALIGPSGAGKSTLIQLLLRFYPLSEGEISINHQPIECFSLRSYRSKFAWVPQEILLFGGTIYENIAYGRPDASEQEVYNAAVNAYAWEFIEKFPEKMQTLVGQRGMKLSGGQRQRIAIARALLKNPQVLILDEATSALDTESEVYVQQALENLMKNRTTLIVAHRLSTIRNADWIVVLHNGKIAECGTHQSLLQNNGGIYARMLQMQSEPRVQLVTDMPMA